MSRAGDSPRLNPLASNPVSPNGEDEGDGDNSSVDQLDESQKVAVVTPSAERSSPSSSSRRSGLILLSSACYDPDEPVLVSDNESSGVAVQSSPSTQSSPKEDSVGSRIPRPAGFKGSRNSSTAKGTRSGSSIPVPIQRRSAEQLGVASQEKQNESSSSGVRPLEKPRGPRPRPIKQATTPASEPSPRVDVESEESSSPLDGWDFKDISPVESERPATVFTGEHRIRRLAMPTHSTSSPTLRIASSAEDVIMGNSGCKSSESATAIRSTPSLLQRLGGKFVPSTPKTSETPKGNTPAKGKGGPSSSREGTPSRKYCRPQLSLDNLQRRDISGKEMSISRKPISRPSLSSLFTPSLKSLRVEEEPIVPKIPDQYSTGQETSLRRVSGDSISPETPKVAAESEGASTNTESEDTPIPETAIRHPPRTSSLYASSELPVSLGIESSPSIASGLRSKAANLKRNVTFNDISPFASHVEHAGQTPGRTKLPESKSTHLLGNLRNMIFRSRGGAAEKELAKAEENEALTLKENAAPESEEGLEKENLPRHDSEKSLKSKPKYTRLSGGVSWNRGSRNPKNEPESPGTPTPSAPRLLAPPNRLSDVNTPSFARSTMSTSIKASSASKSQASATPDSQARKPHVRTASSGSPQPVARTKRTPGNLLMRSVKKGKKSGLSISSPIPIPGRTAPVLGESNEGVPKNLEAFHHCVDILCNKVAEASTALERERHIRLALSLQHQLGEYLRVEKAAVDAEGFAAKKLEERREAEDALNAALTDAQTQLEMD